MSVYLDELARTLAGRGVAVDVFTRRHAPGFAELMEIVPGYRVIHIADGPGGPVPTRMLAERVEEFAGGVIDRVKQEGESYQLVHAHYWLSGWAGLLVADALGIPMANSFHTLGKVKNLGRRGDEPIEALVRIAAEEELIRRSGCVIASTQAEFDDLVQHYGAFPEGVCISPPGVDHDRFVPGDRDEARRRLGLGGGRMLLAVGRIQPIKGFELAVETLAILAEHFDDLGMVLVGGPSGPRGDAELAHLTGLARERGVADRLTVLPPRPHSEMPLLYQAADLTIVPSRSESFGLVAAEAQACGVPVVAANVGGLAYVVADQVSGLLVKGQDPRSFAAAAHRILSQPQLAERLSRGGLENSAQFSWEATANRLLELYAGMVDEIPG